MVTSGKGVTMGISKTNHCKCKKCSTDFYFVPDEDTWWNEEGTYSEKLVKCTNCDCINVVQYVDGYNQNPNLDERYFG